MYHLQNPVREPESLATIRFQDCDPFGHLNNARYVDYFLNARQDQLAAHYDLHIYEPNNPAQASWVVKQTQIAYLRPAQVMEQVLIRTRLIHFTEKIVVVEGRMLDKEAMHLKALIWIEFAYIGLVSGKPTNHPEEFLELCRAVVMLQEYSADGFNTRVESVKMQFRQRVPKMETLAAPAMQN